MFQAALNARRAEVWAAGADRLRALIPKALDTLGQLLETGNHAVKLKAAAEILRLAQLPDGSSGTGPTEPEEVVRAIVSERRSRAPEPLDDLLNVGKGLPPFERQLADTWQELEALANESDPPAGEG